MKLLITYGQSKENAGTRICADWGSKKKGRLYTELSELAGREITDSEVKFIDVSKHASNERVQNFFKEYTLEKLLLLYGRHAKDTKIPAEYRGAIQDYVNLWLQYSGRFQEWERRKGNVEELHDFQELKGKAEALSGKYRGLRKKEISIEFLFPEELRGFVGYGRKDILKAITDMDELEAVIGEVHTGKNALDSEVEMQLKPELAQNVAVIDFQCSPGGLFSNPGKLYGYNRICIPSQPSKGVPWYKKPMFWARQSGRKDDLAKRLGKYANTGLAVERGDGLKCAFPYVSVEIWPTISEKKSKDLHKDFCKYPTFHFLQMLNRIFTDNDPFLSVFKFCHELGRVTDAGFYQTRDFTNAKKFVAGTVQAILEWGENYESSTK